MDSEPEGGLDDDVHMETVDEGQEVPQPAPSGPTENSNPGWLVDGFFSFFDVIQDNGWILLVILIGLWFLKRKLEEHLREKRKRDDDGMHAKDPDKLLDLQLRREERIRRLQEQQDAAAAVAAEKQREKEEKERKERIQDYDDFLAGKGYKPKSKYGTGNTSSNEENADPPSPPSLLTNRPRPRLRNDDYNPMMGSGGSGGYRPAPRGGAGGGG